MKRVWNEIKTAWKWVTRWVDFALRFLVIHNDIVWVDPNTNEEVSREGWTRRQKIRTLRPRYYGLSKELECGCTARLWGHIYLFNMRCPEHGMGDWLNQMEDEADEETA